MCLWFLLLIPPFCLIRHFQVDDQWLASYDSRRTQQCVVRASYLLEHTAMSRSPNRIRESDHQREVTHAEGLVADSPSDTPERSPDISPAEADELRAEKLAAIRKAVEAGAYDSDEMLDKGLKRMLESMDDEP